MIYNNMHLYCNEKIEKKFIERYDLIYKKENLSFVEIKKGIVHKYIRNINNLNFTDNYDYGCVTDENYNVVDESCLYRGEKIYCGKVYKKEVDEYIDKEVIYLGLQLGHFGHELLDGCSRLWFFNKNIDIKDYCYISEIDVDDYYSIFRLLGINKINLIRVNKNIQFKKVIVPHISDNLVQFYSDEFKETFYKIGHSIKPSNKKKIYLSRTQFSYKGSATIGERNIENIFKNNDFTIVYPETEKLETVISLMKGAEVVAGVSGSNMHNIIFARDNITQYNLMRSTDVNTVQILIDKMKNIKTYNIESFYEIIPLTRHYSVPYFVYMTKYLELFFNDVNIIYNKLNMYETISHDIINYLKLYSEISISNGPFEIGNSSIYLRDIIYNLSNLFNYYPIENINKDSIDLKIKKEKKSIDKLVWWIPIRKIRDEVRKKMNKKINEKYYNNNI